MQGKGSLTVTDLIQLFSVGASVGGSPVAEVGLRPPDPEPAAAAPQRPPLLPQREDVHAVPVPPKVVGQHHRVPRGRGVGEEVVGGAGAALHLLLVLLYVPW